jgi:amino acid transporter
MSGTFSGELEARLDNPAQPHQVQRLRKNAVGLMGVLFMTVATAAPITAMLGNVPIAIGSGNGQYAPAGYLVATIILALFAIGYAQMAKYITATGAFYGFISHGLGRVVGMASGIAVTLTYIVFEAALVGIFAFFCEDLLASVAGCTFPGSCSPWPCSRLMAFSATSIFPSPPRCSGCAWCWKFSCWR